MIILFGYSKLAVKIAYLLKSKNYIFSIVEPDKSKYDFAKNDKYSNQIYNYNFYDDNELISLGIKTNNIKTIYCMHDDFNKNLLLTLSARNLNAKVQIISISKDKNETKKLKLAGANSIVNPNETTGLKLFKKIHRPISLQVLDSILYSDSSLQIKEIIIQKNTILDGIYLSDIQLIKDNNLIFLGIQDREISSDFIFSSRGINHKLDNGDTIVILGKSQDIENFTKLITSNN